MQKKFKFRLEGVLKLRGFEEEKAKIELGKIVREKENLLDQISSANKDIDLTYDSYDKAQGTISNSGLLSFFPSYIKSIKDKIKILNDNLAETEVRYLEQLKKLAQIMGDKKVVEKLKEKKKNEHNKKMNKKMDEQREELFSIGQRLKMGRI